MQGSRINETPTKISAEAERNVRKAENVFMTGSNPSMKETTRDNYLTATLMGLETKNTRRLFKVPQPYVDGSDFF